MGRRCTPLDPPDAAPNSSDHGRLTRTGTATGLLAHRGRTTPPGAALRTTDPCQPPARPTRPGHNVEVLGELGCAPGEMAALRAQNVM
jgi:hypothetical protein